MCVGVGVGVCVVGVGAGVGVGTAESRVQRVVGEEQRGAHYVFVHTCFRTVWSIDFLLWSKNQMSLKTLKTKPSARILKHNVVETANLSMTQGAQ